MRRSLQRHVHGLRRYALIAGEERTRETFGDHIGTHDFGASIRDGATVPFLHENRIPELQRANDGFNTDLEQISEDIALNEAERREIKRVARDMLKGCFTPFGKSEYATGPTSAGGRRPAGRETLPEGDHTAYIPRSDGSTLLLEM